MKRYFTLLLFIWLPLALVVAQERPNIIVIVSDDAGYADFSFQSTKLTTTPNIDRIAQEGAKFTNAYVTAKIGRAHV